MEQGVWMWDVMHIFASYRPAIHWPAIEIAASSGYPAAAADRPPGTVPNVASPAERRTAQFQSPAQKYAARLWISALRGYE